jgi:hypothetical protein
MNSFSMRACLKLPQLLHRIHIKRSEIAELRRAGNDFGIASCDACHIRHTFSVADARQPHASETCHMGLNHLQWEMYEGSKNGRSAGNRFRNIHVPLNSVRSWPTRTTGLAPTNHLVQKELAQKEFAVYQKLCAEHLS